MTPDKNPTTKGGRVRRAVRAGAPDVNGELAAMGGTVGYKVEGLAKVTR